MCGIIGFYNNKESVKLVKKGLFFLKHRGNDGFGITNLEDINYNSNINLLNIKEKNNSIGHVLHAIVSKVKQPLIITNNSKEKKIISTNCEIYNWKELSDKYNINAKNDAELLLNLLNKKDIKALEEIDGPYAFSYDDGKKIILARDIIGIKPLFYSLDKESFSFSSEKKALKEIKIKKIKELNPRKILIYDKKTKKISFQKRKFFKITPLLKKDEKTIIEDIQELLIKSVKKRIPNVKFGVLFSGGVDSSTIAIILKKQKVKFTLYTSALNEPELKESEDLVMARKISKELNLPLKENIISLKETEKYLPLIIKTIESFDVTKVGVALPFFLACKKASEDGCKVLLSGLGSEEIFAGYQRHKESKNINKECKKGLLKMYIRDNYRDDTLSMKNKIELRHPFLDKKLIDYALKIPSKFKINNDEVKLILRKASKELGLKNEFAYRKKKAAQYGSNFDKAIQKLSNKKKLTKAQYLRNIYK
jgi:diphthine-ammonia ligase